MKLYSKSHEWVEVDGNQATVGISNFAAEELGDVTYLEMPEIDEVFAAGEMFGSIESVKAASDLFLPIGGKIIEINEQLEDEPELVNDDPEGKGWICRIEEIVEEDLKNLLSEAEYLEFVRS